VPDKIINESQARQLNESIAANALTGRDKSAVIACINHKTTKHQWRLIFYHEFMHIFCAKTEMDGEHFIDIYGSGHTPDENPSDKEYDGYLNAGYVVWTEFIAHYFTIKNVDGRAYSFHDVAEYAYSLLDEVTIDNDGDDHGKAAFAVACAYLLTCDDGNILSDLVEPDDLEADGKRTQMVLRNCLEHLHNNLQKEKPWKISKAFIAELGRLYVTFKVMNCFDTGLLNMVCVDDNF
jgi:hypothetical protein